MFPIGRDSFGNDIIIGVSEDNYGKIYFYDHETGKFSYIVDDFQTFLEKIKSEKLVIRSIEERIKSRKEKKLEVTDEWIRIWQTEIDYFSGRQQEIVEI